MKRFSRYTTRAAGRAPYPYRKSYYRRPRPQDRAQPAAIYRGVQKELKGVDFKDTTPRDLVTITNVVGATSLTTGMCLLNGIANGTNFFERVGNKVQMKSLAVELELWQPQTDVSSSSVRLLIVYDRQCNGAYPLYSDVLMNGNIAGSDFNSGMNLANRDRFAILRDAQFVLDPAQDLQKHYETFIQRPLDATYGTTTAIMSGVSSGAIYIMLFYVQGLGTTAPKCNNLHARYRYWDS